jgi:hypothetical protein
VTFGDPMFLLAQRLIGKTVDPQGKGIAFAIGTPSSLLDIGSIIVAILAAVNGDGKSGVRMGAVTASSNSYAGPWYMKKAAEAIAELSGTLGGPDFEIVPLEPDTTVAFPNTEHGELRVYGSQGSLKPNVLFEYGTGKLNCSGYRRLLDKGGLANKVFSLPQGYPDSSTASDTVVSSQDAASIAAWGLREDVAAGDIANPSMRSLLAGEHVRVRKNPRQQVFFTPAQNVAYDYGRDYSVGDQVTARAYEDGSWRVNDVCRIYSAQFTLDPNGAEQLELGLVPGE